MVAANEFWLQVYRLATAYEGEGLTTTERNEQIVAEFHDMPPIAQREVVAALLRLTVHVPSIYTLVVADIRKTKHQKRKCPRALEKSVPDWAGKGLECPVDSTDRPSNRQHFGLLQISPH
jgi:hypothetical protein